jgi:NADH-quinone oxidoreductase subunit F
MSVDSVLGPPDSGWVGGTRRIDLEGHAAFGGQATRAKRHLLLPVLHAIQSRFGWISSGALSYACQRLDVPPAEAFGVASFYGLFSVTPRPPVVVHICDDIACLVSGAKAMCEKLEQILGSPGSPGPDGRTTWLRSPCLGLCERAPAALLSAAGKRSYEKVLAPASLETITSCLNETQPEPGNPSERLEAPLAVPQAGQAELRLLRRIGRVNPESLDDYRAEDGYKMLRRALELGPDRVIREVIDSKLVGRGGAAFPAGKKWAAVAAQTARRPHYLVCNADESEPGTFKDRVVMEGDPFALVEAMTIAGFAAGCERGYLYIRGEYPLATERMARALERTRERGLLGDNILGHRLSFDIEIRRGAGAYICGEETALFSSIEGFRGEPRNKPPFPTEAGLFGKPTVVNNVETLINVLDILGRGGAAYASTGTSGSTGTKLFCLSGHIARPGVYEVPFGTTLRHLIDLGGGVSGSRRLQAILLGGAAGFFVSPQQLDTPLTFEGTRAIGASLGSGVVMLFDDTVDLKEILLRIAAFFRDESCGQCVPCRVGTVRQEELLHRLADGRPMGSLAKETSLLREIGQAMRDASICGLGQTASSAIESAMAGWERFNERKHP